MDNKNIDIVKNRFHSSSDKTIQMQLKRGNITHLLQQICIYNDTDNSLIIDCNYIKSVLTKQLYSTIIDIITSHLDNILTTNNVFNIHINIPRISLRYIDSHRTFIYETAAIFKDRYPNKMGVCYLYNTSSIFSCIYKIISFAIDKETKQKIRIIE